MKKSKLIVVFAVVLVIIVSAVVYFMPISFSELTINNKMVKIDVFERDFEDDEFVHGFETYEFAKDSSEQQELYEILEKYNYSRRLFGLPFEVLKDDLYSNIGILLIEENDYTTITIETGGICTIEGKEYYVYNVYELINEIENFLS